MWSPSIIFFLTCVHFCHTVDITEDVFGSFRHGMPAAFGDFNADKLTDLIVITNEGKTVEVLLAYEEKPFLRSESILCSFVDVRIKNVVPGDFDGDGNMDLLVVGRTRDDPGHKTRVYILYGDSKVLDCQKSDDHATLTLQGQPLVLDYNSDMIHDVFGVSYVSNERKFWIFGTKRSVDYTIPMNRNNTLRVPNSHGFLDLNQDFNADIILTANDGFEYWFKTRTGFKFHELVVPPEIKEGGVIGQSLFMDFDLDGRVDHLIPVCGDVDCLNSNLYVYLDQKWINVDLDLRDANGNKWNFIHPRSVTRKYLDTLTLRVGDYNLDGFPDIIATLVFNGQYRVFLLENFECKTCPLKRKLSMSWSYFNEHNSTVMGAFYDINENGILDAILVKQVDEKAEVVAIKSLIEYDAYFLKVLVASNRCMVNCSVPGDLPYGASVPGASLCYKTYASEGQFRESCMSQLPQSSHFSMQLPYVVFGLGRMPNFVETLQIGAGEGKYHEWTQIIPNSQMVVIPPVNGDGRWNAKLFVTPSKAIILTAVALGGLCVFLVMLIFVLHTKEKREDRIEKLQEAHKFHFDAM